MVRVAVRTIAVLFAVGVALLASVYAQATAHSYGQIPTNQFALAMVITVGLLVIAVAAVCVAFRLTRPRKRG